MLTRCEIEAMIEDTGGVRVRRWKIVGQGHVVDETWGHFEVVDESGGPASLIGQETVVVPTEALPEIREGEQVEVEGEGMFLVQFSVREGDGALSRIALVEA